MSQEKNPKLISSEVSLKGNPVACGLNNEEFETDYPYMKLSSESLPSYQILPGKPMCHKTAFQENLDEYYKRIKEQPELRRVILSDHDQWEFVRHLTKRQIFLLTNSWLVLRRDLETNGFIIFLNLLTSYPELRKKFKSPSFKVPDLHYSTGAAEHGLIFMTYLDKVIANISNQKICLTTLYLIGKMHARMGLTDYHFQMFKEGFIKILRDILKNKFTQEVEEAWNTFTRILIEIFQDASNWNATGK